MKEDKELWKDPETMNNGSDLEDTCERMSSPCEVSKKKGDISSSEDETAEPGDSDNDSGFIGTSRSSLDQLDEADEGEQNATRKSNEHIRNHYLDLLARNLNQQKLKTSVSRDSERGELADMKFDKILKNIGNKYDASINYEKLTEEEQQAWINKNLRESLEILPDSLVNILAGFYRYGDCGMPLTERPDWLDMKKFLRGQKFAQENVFGINFSQMISLFALFSFDDGLKPLIITGKSSTPYASFKRYLSTASRIRNWFTEDPWTEGTAAHRDIRVVRRMHENVRKKLHSSSNEENDAAAKIANPWSPSRDLLLEDFQSACPAPAMGQCPYMTSNSMFLKPKGLNQGEMAATQFGFVGLMVVFPEAFGVHYAADEDLEAFCHAWRGIGYLLGVEDEYNFCRGTLDDVRQRSQDILEFWVKPNFRQITPEWEHMMRCLIEGVNYYVPGNTYETSLLYFTNLLNLEIPRFYASISYSDWIFYNLSRSLLMYTIRLPGLKTFLNYKVNKSIDEALKFSPEKHAELQKNTYSFQGEKEGVSKCVRTGV